MIECCVCTSRIVSRATLLGRSVEDRYRRGAQSRPDCFLSQPPLSRVCGDRWSVPRKKQPNTHFRSDVTVRVWESPKVCGRCCLVYGRWRIKALTEVPSEGPKPGLSVSADNFTDGRLRSEFTETITRDILVPMFPSRYSDINRYSNLSSSPDYFFNSAQQRGKVYVLQSLAVSKETSRLPVTRFRGGHCEKWVALFAAVMSGLSQRN
ncbi:hypothetical protein J6590_043411 [Homalodisca vitripennis]|nr:hypothetical protein J6590_043411 [Homalodisca vitripennis]